MVNIFYSWQSDHSDKTNRRFIREALERAINKTNLDANVRVVAKLADAIRGKPGSPDIAAATFKTIDESLVFVCDVSIVNRRASQDYQDARPTPNPNVLLELGYALANLGPDRILQVMNSSHGSPEDLPFDIRPRRCITYTASLSNFKNSSEQDRLERELAEGLRKIFEKPFGHLEGDWEPLDQNRNSHPDYRSISITCTSRFKLEVKCERGDPNKTWSGRIKIDPDMPNWGDGFYNYDHGKESGRLTIIIEDPNLIRVFPIAMTHATQKTRYYFWRKRLSSEEA